MDSFQEIYCTNSEEEVMQIENSFNSSGIIFKTSINNTVNPVFGISSTLNSRDLSYKFQIHVQDSSIEKAQQLLKKMFEIETTTDEISVNDYDVDKHVTNEKQTIARSIFILLLFAHLSRFYQMIFKELKSNTLKIILTTISIVYVSCVILIITPNMTDSYEKLIYLTISMFLFVIYQFIINIIDFLITKSKVQLIVFSILLIIIAIFLCLMIPSPK